MNEAEASGQLSPKEKINKAIADIDLLEDAFKTIIGLPPASQRTSFQGIEQLVPEGIQEGFWQKWPKMPKVPIAELVKPSEFPYDTESHARLWKEFSGELEYIRKCNNHEDQHSLSDPSLPEHITSMFHAFSLVSFYLMGDGGHHSLPGRDQESEAVNESDDFEKDVLALLLIGPIGAALREIKQTVRDAQLGKTGGDRTMGM